MDRDNGAWADVVRIPPVEEVPERGRILHEAKNVVDMLNNRNSQRGLLSRSSLRHRRDERDYGGRREGVGHRLAVSVWRKHIRKKRPRAVDKTISQLVSTFGSEAICHRQDDQERGSIWDGHEERKGWVKKKGKRNPIEGERMERPRECYTNSRRIQTRGL